MREQVYLIRANKVKDFQLSLNARDMTINLCIRVPIGLHPSSCFLLPRGKVLHLIECGWDEDMLGKLLVSYCVLCRLACDIPGLHLIVLRIRVELVFILQAVILYRHNPHLVVAENHSLRHHAVAKVQHPVVPIALELVCKQPTEQVRSLWHLGIF